MIPFEAGFDEPIIRCIAEIAAGLGIREEIVLLSLKRDGPFQCFGTGAGLAEIQQRLDEKCVGLAVHLHIDKVFVEQGGGLRIL